MGICFLTACSPIFRAKMAPNTKPKPQLTKAISKVSKVKVNAACLPLAQKRAVIPSIKRAMGLLKASVCPKMSINIIWKAKVSKALDHIPSPQLIKISPQVKASIPPSERENTKASSIATTLRPIAMLKGLGSIR